jgi:DNA repair exonuclease SbcCD nuclease subunit
MKKLIIGDLHTKEKAEWSRPTPSGLTDLLEVQQQTMEWIVKLAHAHEVGGIVFLGDLFDRPDPLRAACIKVVMDGFGLLNAIESVVQIDCVLGNHDMIDKTGLIHAQVILEGFEKVTVHTEATTNGREAFIPYPVKQPKEFLQALQGYATKPQVIYAHHPINGGLLRKGLRDSGCATNEEDYGQYSAVIMGHYHHPENRGNVVYAGSPMMHDWSDAIVELPRGVLLLEVTDKVHIERYANPHSYTFESWVLGPTEKDDTEKLFELQQLFKSLDQPERTLLRVRFDPARSKEVDLIRAKLKPKLKALYTRQEGHWSEYAGDPTAGMAPPAPATPRDPEEVVKDWVREHPSPVLGIEDTGLTLIQE